MKPSAQLPPGKRGSVIRMAGDLPIFDDAFLSPLLDQVSDGVAVAAPGPWRLVYASPTLANWLGKPVAELRGRPLEDIFGVDSRAKVLELADKVFQGAAPKASMIGDLQSDPATIGAADVRFCRLAAGEKALLGVVIRRTVAPPHVAAATAERRDPLTGLADREFLLGRLAALLHGERASDKHFAVLFIDLDNFKQVNDAHGHLMGDRVLREVARRLSGCVRDGDHVVRFGGDEFVVLAEEVAGPSEIEPIIRRIQTALAKPIALPEGEFTLSLSIGAAEATPDHHSPDDLLRDADRAMYAIKRAQNADGTFPAAG